MRKPNPWSAAIPSLTPAEIRKRVRLHAVPVTGLGRESIEQACARLDAGFAAVYLPTEQDVVLIQYLLDHARAHAALAYPSAQAFLDVVYAVPGNTHSISPPVPIILSGLAGTGKTEIAKAIGRLLAGKVHADVGKHHPRFPIHPTWRLEVDQRTSLTQVRQPLESLRHLIPAAAARTDRRRGVANESEATRTLSHEDCQHILYKVGMCLLFIDETQWVTRSEKANAFAATLVSGVARLGPQVVIVMNYSMAHRLLARPQEERQRIWGKPKPLLPLDCSSPDWLATVKELIAVAPDIYTFDPEEGARILHTYTAGLRRPLRALLLEAFRLSKRRGREVTLVELRKAYESVAYKTNREDVLLIHQQNVSGQMADAKRRDLWCPFELPETASKRENDTTQANRRAAVREVFLQSSLTREERAGFEALKRAARDRSSPAQRSRSARHRVLTLEDAVEGDSLLMRGVRGRRS